MVNRFILQWHISEICNLKCLHCYQDGHKPIALSYQQLLLILEQYREFLKKLKEVLIQKLKRWKKRRNSANVVCIIFLNPL